MRVWVQQGGEYAKGLVTLMELKTVSPWPAVSKIHVPPLLLCCGLHWSRLPVEGSDGDPGVGVRIWTTVLVSGQRESLPCGLHLRRPTQTQLLAQEVPPPPLPSCFEGVQWHWVLMALVSVCIYPFMSAYP